MLVSVRRLIYAVYFNLPSPRSELFNLRCRISRYSALPVSKCMLRPPFSPRNPTWRHCTNCSIPTKHSKKELPQTQTRTRRCIYTIHIFRCRYVPHIPDLRYKCVWWERHPAERNPCIYRVSGSILSFPSHTLCRTWKQTLKKSPT